MSLRWLASFELSKYFSEILFVIVNHLMLKINKTRMHSSRMRTALFLAVSRSSWGGGVCTPPIQTPPDKDPLPLDRDPPWTETPLPERDPPPLLTESQTGVKNYLPASSFEGGKNFGRAPGPIFFVFRKNGQIIGWLPSGKSWIRHCK